MAIKLYTNPGQTLYGMKKPKNKYKCKLKLKQKVKLCEVFNQTKTENQSTLNFATHTDTHTTCERRQTIKQKQSGKTKEAARGKPIKNGCGHTRGMRNVASPRPQNVFGLCSILCCLRLRTLRESLLKFREKLLI